MQWMSKFSIYSWGWGLDADVQNSPGKTVVQDVEFLKSLGGLNEHLKISGLVLDTFTGVLKKII